MLSKALVRMYVSPYSKLYLFNTTFRQLHTCIVTIKTKKYQADRSCTKEFYMCLLDTIYSKSLILKSWLEPITTTSVSLRII